MPTRLIAHRIFKEQRSKESDLHLRDDLIEKSEKADALLKELRGAVTKKSQSGQFEEQAGVKPPFQQRLEEYLSKQSDKEFVDLSRELTQFLQAKMKEQVMATGGFIVFAEHTHGDETLLLIALLSTEARPGFDDNLNLVTSPTLDFDHLRHGVRVRHAGVSSNAPGVVQFVSQKSEGVSDYFREFLGCQKLSDTSEQGRLLYRAIQSVAGEHGLELEEANRIAYSYWERCMRDQKDMTIVGLANLLAPEDPTPVLTSLGDEKYNLAGEFAPPPKKVMNNFVKFAFNEKGLKLEFDKQSWADRIDIIGDTVQIKQSPPELLAKIKNELLNES